ncbi:MULTISPECIES: alpha-L-fucosidase [Petrimonas]|mgnify:FL=1|jgi:alpha-L-fucosidase|uniref:alpha-L-fucosidase n=1 Tax=Petrimonas mucosa TaxID=1642646 RepID=A0A1G4G6M9_9BACT|nr:MULTISPECIES: alpha-L-fucosidase [Petrimonas]MDD3561775.1 alpha-L-fucosidase [Petrimonas mucosa]SCM57503.1 putative alpha-L-fucosidase [Petrimonas mucosa]SFU65982.1 alpha-L-fucosidase [Porphyromonadaceae bacterium KHP3R9]HHT30392.1 alpha-L-fucosidase [Petrimonas mucosa]
MRRSLLLLLLAITMAGTVSAQQNYVPAPENLKNRAEFQDMKFGVFIHWGIYSMMADGEWIMNNKNINWQEYAKLADGFYPSKFDAKKWVADVKAAGAKYICITSRHHDGFSMFHTRQSSYNIVDGTPFKRDIIKELADECHKEGIKLHFYYSQLDWRRADYFPLGRTGRGVGRTEQGNWDSYHRFMLNQLTELLTNYGEIGAIWFDGQWDQPADFDWRLREIYDHIHSIQPGCLIISNHHLAPQEGEDAQTFEKDLPGQNTTGFSGNAAIGELPLETCETMNNSWGYNITDLKYKSEKELIHYLVKAAGNNANLLMNVGPRPDGTFPDIAIQRYKAMGDWLKVYGESIYGTRGGFVTPRDWGVTTQKENRLFVHILNLKDSSLYLPLNGKKVKSARLFLDKRPVKFTQDADGVLLKLDKVPDELDYVVELELK